MWRRWPSQERMMAKTRSEGTLVMGRAAYKGSELAAR
jgi:hypothetical protein